jgi:hypothetical protein
VKLATTPEEQREWVAQWKRAAVALNAVKREELQNLTEEEARKASSMLLGMVSFPRPPGPREETSGLVEQQRWFAKARQKCQGVINKTITGFADQRRRRGMFIERDFKNSP